VFGLLVQGIDLPHLDRKDPKVSQDNTGQAQVQLLGDQAKGFPHNH